MDLFFSAMLALAVSDKTVPAQAAHYGQLAEGLVRSQFVCKGMTHNQVKAVLGRSPESSFASFCWSDDYRCLGVVVSYNLFGVPNNKVCVSEVQWHFYPFQR
jgi:hypothetical protein